MRGNPSPQLFDLIASKFIANLPKEQLNNEQRIAIHFEKAYFYYLDTQGLQQMQTKNEKQKQLINICNQILRVVSCPQMPKLTGTQIHSLISQNYNCIPVCGVIILNMEQTKVILVESQSPCRFGFPKGKINQGQKPEDCAMRQLYEEIGFKAQLDANYFVQTQVINKSFNRTSSKNCKFYIIKVQQSSIISRKSKNHDKIEPGIRQIIHSQLEIKSIGWYKISDEVPALISLDKFNQASDLAFQQLVKKIKKPSNYKQKKQNNPLEQFKGFDEKLGKIFIT